MKIKTVEQLKNVRHTDGYASRSNLYLILKWVQSFEGFMAWQVVKIGGLYYGFLANAHTIEK